MPRPSTTVMRGALGILLVVALWEGGVRLFGLPAYVLPTISAIVLAVIHQHAALGSAAAYTLAEVAMGYVLGCVAGITLASFATMLPLLRGPVLKGATALNSVPVVGYAPLILIWFGTGMESKVIAIVIAAGFVVFISALSGLDRVDERAANLMRSFGAGRLAVFWRLRLPTAAPLIAAGMRVATVRSVIIAIVVEMLGARDGLGWVIYQAVLQIDFVQVWSAILVASAASLVFFAVIDLAGRRLIFWR